MNGKRFMSARVHIEKINARYFIRLILEYGKFHDGYGNQIEDVFAELSIDEAKKLRDDLDKELKVFI